MIYYYFRSEILYNIILTTPWFLGASIKGEDENGKWVDEEAYQALCKTLYDYCLEICEQTNKARM
ncbi:TPA: hypothetical protein EYP66_06380 [Candidatus Poribacteria bacterium]|nr:hypothetical protein [Candidatus Poribacteria bacterium]